MLDALPSQFRKLLTIQHRNCQVHNWLPSSPRFTCLPDYIIAIPIHNEQDRLDNCLIAIEKAMQSVSEYGRLLLLINNSNDASLEKAISFAKRTTSAVEIFDVSINKASSCAGPARALALDLANLLVGAHGAIITTDADSIVDSNFVLNHLKALDQPAAMVCGNVLIDRAEESRLPKEFLLRNRAEQNYWLLCNQLSSILAPDALNPWPHHCHVSGANMSIKASIYSRIGGLPRVDAGEDRALEHRVRQYDYPIYYSDAAKVTTSCRLLGRAKDGMASTLNQRLKLGDFICDSRLEPAAMVWRRAKLYTALRNKWQHIDSVVKMLRLLKLSPATIEQAKQSHSFGSFLTIIETHSPYLYKRELNSSRLLNEIKALQIIISRISARSENRLYLLPSDAVLAARA